MKRIANTLLPAKHSV